MRAFLLDKADVFSVLVAWIGMILLSLHLILFESKDWEFFLFWIDKGGNFYAVSRSFVYVWLFLLAYSIFSVFSECPCLSCDLLIHFVANISFWIDKGGNFYAVC